MSDEDAPTNPQRRRLLKAAAGGLTAVGLVGVGVRAQNEPAGSRHVLMLAAAGGSDVRALEVPLGDQVLPPLGRSTWRSARLPTSTHSMVGFTWPDEAAAPTIEISSRVEGVWSDWRDVPLLRHAPARRTATGRGRGGTELCWIGAATGISVRLIGERPADMNLVLLHPGRRASDRSTSADLAGDVADGQAAALQPRAVPRPTVRPRKSWGADETWRDSRPQIEDTLVQIHVHHTANSNAYTEADVPALLRGMYRYHTKNLGWSDLAYNFVVDQFGGIWQGRAGGAARLVRGAHTLGFNSHSCGIAVIGNFDEASPPPTALRALVALASWKLDAYGIDPTMMTEVVSEGSDKFAAGEQVTLPVVDGHRDTNDTACPGTHLYAALPAIRTRARRRIDRFRSPEPKKVRITTPASLTGTPRLGETLSITPGVYEPSDSVITYQWVRDGGLISGATGSTYTVTAEDLGRRVAARIDVIRSGYEGASEELAASAAATAVPQLSVIAVGKRGRGVVRLGLAVPGAATSIGGVAWVRVGERVARVQLEAGRGKARFSDLAKGRYSVEVTYRGDGGYIERTSGSASMRVRRKRRS